MATVESRMLSGIAAQTDSDVARHAQEQTLLFRYTDRLYRAQDLDAVYQASLDACCEALGCTRAAILRFDERGIMRFVSWRGLSDLYREAVEGHSPWSAGDRGAQPICLSDVAAADIATSLKATLSGEGIRSLAFVPITVDDRVIGKFMVYYDHIRLFTPGDRELALIIARQLGFAIERNRGEAVAGRLAAIVDSSYDAIISKSLDGTITSWNGGAERIFGYSAGEAIGRNITMLIPADRLSEETHILDCVSTGRRVEPYDTVRQRRDGTLIHVSLTISPISDANGRVIGASKIARDITKQREAMEQERLLLQEMNHRVKNLFALAGSLVHLSARSATSAQDLAAEVSRRLEALAHAHALTLSPSCPEAPQTGQGARLHELVGTILTAFDTADESRLSRIMISGENPSIGAKSITPLALLLHELATNAAKYGSLAAPDGDVAVSCIHENGQFVLRWRERGGPTVQHERKEGFGSQLIAAAARQLGTMSRAWQPDGLIAELVMDPAKIRD